MYNKLLVFSVVFTLFLLISGCSSDDTTGPDDPGTGSFNATITGYYEKDISGISVFGSAIDEEFDEEAFLIAMMTDQEDMSTGDYIWMGRIGATRPGTGTYQIGNPDDIEDDEWNPEHFYLAYWSFNEENGEHTGGFF